jgi:hypothetical protein
MLNTALGRQGETIIQKENLPINKHKYKAKLEESFKVKNYANLSTYKQQIHKIKLNQTLYRRMTLNIGQYNKHTI